MFMRRLRYLLSRHSYRRDMEEEMALHRELRARQIAAYGMDASQAGRAASRLFGNETLLKEQANDMWGWNWLEDLARDVRQTGRMLAANRGFAAVAILTLSLGIGANTAIFTVANILLMKRMPVHDPEQLYRVQTDRMPNEAFNTGDSSTSFSAAVFDRLRVDQRFLSDLVAYVPLGYNKISVRTGSMPEEASADMVSGNFFTGLGVRAACGRVFSNQDEVDHSPLAEVSYGYAALRFGSPCAAVGQPIVVKGVPLTIAGVADRSFKGIESMPTDIWIPFQTRPELNAWGSSDANYLAAPKWWCILMMARVKPGVTRAEAEAALNPVFQRAAYEPMGGKPQRGEHPVQLHLEPAQGIAGSVSLTQPLLILQVMVGLLLVIACSNVSMLLVVRNAARAKEFCVRLALGGSKSRLMRQMLAESLLLVSAGTVLGLVLAIAATQVLGRWAQLEIAPAPDRTVLLFTLAVSVAAAIAFAIGPALGAARTPIAESIKTSASTAHREKGKVAAGQVLTVLQLALCLVLLTGTGLLVRTLQNLATINIGFPTAGLLVFGISPHAEARDNFYVSVIAKLRSLPQVQSVTLMGNRIASGWSNNTTGLVDGKEPQSVGDTMLRWNNVGPDFFSTLGVRLLAGRDFNDADSAKSAPVAIVNRTFMARFLKGRSALGHTTSFTPQRSFTIVGVVEDSKYTRFQEEPIPMAWFPFTQTGDAAAMHVELRTTGPALAILPAVRAAVASIAPDLALLQPKAQQAEFDQSIATQSLLAKLSISFAALAIVLVAIGLYGTISYGVKRRTAELGIRVALGARQGSVVWMVLRGALVLCVVGLGIGIPLVVFSSHMLASLLYGVTATDPLSIISAVLSILLVAALAAFLPARRAASIDPIKALRYE